MSYEIDLASKIWELDQKKSALSKQLDEIKKEYAHHCNEMIDYLVEEGKGSTGKIDGVGNLSLKRELYPNITKANMPQFIQYLKGKGEGSLVKEVIPPATLKQYLRDLKDNLITQIEEAEPGDFNPIVQLFGKNTNLFYHFRSKLEKATEERGYALEPEEIAAMALDELGCYTHQEIKLSHTMKGK